jgi:hypothetical protein
MQKLIHLQMTGKELGPDMSAEQIEELITVAMRGRKVLLVLDDVWLEDHEQTLNSIDQSTASKTLVVSRLLRSLGCLHSVLPVPDQLVMLYIR